MIRFCACLAFMALLIGSIGCKRTETITSATEEAVSAPTDAQQEKLLAEILEIQKATGSNLKTLVEDLQRRQTMEADGSGDPALLRDLAVARAALGRARAAVESKDAEAAAAALRDLQLTLVSMQAELPANRIAQFASRALIMLGSEDGIGQDLSAASAALLSAADAAINGRPTTLVPDMLKEIESARARVDKGEPQAARKAIEAIVTRASGHTSIGTMQKALAAARGASESLGRGAWPVVAAELAELGGKLDEIARTARPQEAEATTSEQAPAEERADETPEVREPATDAAGEAPAALPMPDAAAPVPAAPAR